MTLTFLFEQMKWRAQLVTHLTFKPDQENSSTVSRTLHVFITNHIVCTAAELGPHYDKLILNATSNQSSSTPAVKFPCSCCKSVLHFQGTSYSKSKAWVPLLWQYFISAARKAPYNACDTYWYIQIYSYDYIFVTL